MTECKFQNFFFVFQTSLNPSSKTLSIKMLFDRELCSKVLKEALLFLLFLLLLAWKHEQKMFRMEKQIFIVKNCFKLNRKSQLKVTKSSHIFTAICGLVGLSMALGDLFCGLVLPFMILYSLAWSCMVLYGLLWYCVAFYDRAQWFKSIGRGWHILINRLNIDRFHWKLDWSRKVTSENNQV